MKYALGIWRRDLVKAGFKEGDEGRVLVRKTNLCRLAKNSQTTSVAAEGFEKRQRIGTNPSVRVLPVEKREGEGEHQSADEIERKGRSHSAIKLATARRAQQFEQMSALIRPKHPLLQARRKCHPTSAGLCPNGNRVAPFLRRQTTGFANADCRSAQGFF